MNLSKAEVGQLRKLVAECKRILIKLDGPKAKKGASGARTERAKRMRRSGKELAEFRKLLVSERKRRVPVAELAQKHGVTTAYIYMLK
jgi:hypothetical protein